MVVRSREDLKKIYDEGNKLWTHNNSFIDYPLLMKWCFDQELDVVLYTYGVFLSTQSEEGVKVCEHLSYIIAHKELVSYEIFPN